MIGSFFKFITPTCCKSTRSVDTFESIDTRVPQPIFSNNPFSALINSNAPLTECVPFQFAQNYDVPFATEVVQVSDTNHSDSLIIVTAKNISFIPECNVYQTNITEQTENSMKNNSAVL